MSSLTIRLSKVNDCRHRFVASLYKFLNLRWIAARLSIAFLSVESDSLSHVSRSPVRWRALTQRARDGRAWLGRSRAEMARSSALCTARRVDGSCWWRFVWICLHLSGAMSGRLHCRRYTSFHYLFLAFHNPISHWCCRPHLCQGPEVGHMNMLWYSNFEFDTDHPGGGMRDQKLRL